jgi:hypothetical protein
MNTFDQRVVATRILERDVEYGLDHVAPTTDEADGVAVACSGRAPDDRPGLVLPQRRDRLAGVARGRLTAPTSRLCSDMRRPYVRRPVVT